jgi:hypothetical protein
LAAALTITASTARSTRARHEVAFPDPIALEIGSRLYVTKWTPTAATTQLCALARQQRRTVLEQFAYRGFPDPKSRKYPGEEQVHRRLRRRVFAALGGYNKEYADILALPGVKK